MKHGYVYGLAALLSVIGLSVFFYKWQILGFPLTEDQEKPVWTIESAISFDSGPGSIKVQLHVPTLTPGFRMLNENSVSRGYGFSLNYGSGFSWRSKRRISISICALGPGSDTSAAGRREIPACRLG